MSLNKNKNLCSLPQTTPTHTHIHIQTHPIELLHTKTKNSDNKQIAVRESYTKQPAYCRSLCSPIPQIIKSKKDQVLDAYLQSKRKEIANQGTCQKRVFISFLSTLN